MTRRNEDLPDFTGAARLFNYYQGANRKFPIDLGGERFMLKLTEPLEPSPKHPSMVSRANAPVSEYLGCHVFELAGLPVQETLLGTFDGEPAVACKDFIFAMPGGAGRYVLSEFSSIATEMCGSSGVGRTPGIEVILGTLRGYPGLEPLREAAEERFWRTFAVDALIGNFDRHCGNWGYIVDAAQGGLVGLAPVYDCGSSLYSRISLEGMAERLSDERAFRARVRDQPRPCLAVGGKPRPTFESILSGEYGGLAGAALAWVREAVNMEDVYGMVESTPGLAEVQVEFYKTALRLRMEEVVERGARAGRAAGVSMAASPELSRSVSAAMGAVGPGGGTTSARGL